MNYRSLMVSRLEWKMNDLFHRFSCVCSNAVGSSWSFILAVFVVTVWAVTGPLFSYSDTWQLMINTGTTIITFLMVFLIQHTQNRDSQCTQLKLDELIRALDGARTKLVNLESLSEDDLKQLREEFKKLEFETDHK